MLTCLFYTCILAGLSIIVLEYDMDTVHENMKNGVIILTADGTDVE